jgi:hypothetical protein
MSMTVQHHDDHTKFILDPRRDGKRDWDQAACTWLVQYVNFNPSCPWDDNNKAIIGSELLSSGLPLQNWVEKWGSASSLRRVWFKFCPGDKPWNLEIGASVGANTSAIEYRVLDIANQFLGVDEAGNLTQMVAPTLAPPNRGIRGSVAPPGPQQQAAKIVTAPVTPQQVAKTVADVNSHLQAAGRNVDAALNRLTNMAVGMDRTQLAVNRTQAALEQLVNVAATAPKR